MKGVKLSELNEIVEAKAIIVWGVCISLEGFPGALWEGFSMKASGKDFEFWLSASDEEVIAAALKLMRKYWSDESAEFHGQILAVELLQHWPDKPVQSHRFIEVADPEE